MSGTPFTEYLQTSSDTRIARNNLNDLRESRYLYIKYICVFSSINTMYSNNQPIDTKKIIYMPKYLSVSCSLKTVYGP